jgi:hypothetical protein
MGLQTSFSTIAQPTTGNTFQSGNYGLVDNRFYQRGPLACILIRDNLGPTTNISPYTTGPTLNFTPFAKDGNLRTDLFADKLVSGNWFLNTAPNMGFWRIGAFDEKGGPDRKGAIKHDDQMILQSNFPFDTDLTGQGQTIMFTPIESLKPVIVRLRMNLPLVDPTNTYSIVEDVGQPNMVLSVPVTYTSPDRQILAVFARQQETGYVYTVEAYPLVKLTDIGAQKRDKTAPDSGPLTFTALLDPFFTDIDRTNPNSGNVVPAFTGQWIGGPGWSTMFESGS